MRKALSLFLKLVVEWEHWIGEFNLFQILGPWILIENSFKLDLKDSGRKLFFCLVLCEVSLTLKKPLKISGKLLFLYWYMNCPTRNLFISCSLRIFADLNKGEV